MSSEAKCDRHARIGGHPQDLDLAFESLARRSESDSMSSTTSSVSEKDRAYRRRLAAEGRHQLIVALPKETVALIDTLVQQRGLRNRSQALQHLIEQGRQATQQSV